MKEKEMIEEMKQILIDWAISKDLCFSFEVMQKHAEVLYNAGYRKIPEGAVVLSKEEYELFKSLEESYYSLEKTKDNLLSERSRLMLQIAQARKITEPIKLTPVGYGKENGCYYADIIATGQEFPQRIYFKACYFEKEEIRKETAKEILKLVKEKSWCCQEDENGEVWTYSITVTQLKELADKYGVKVE